MSGSTVAPPNEPNCQAVSSIRKLGLIVIKTLKLKRGERGRRLFNLATFLDVAHNKPMPSKMLARAMKCSERTIKRKKCATAFAHLRVQEVICKMVCSYIESHPPTAVICNTMWDETAERLAFDVHAAIRQSCEHTAQGCSGCPPCVCLSFYPPANWWPSDFLAGHRADRFSWPAVLSKSTDRKM